ncbi:MAG: YCF48-related protein [Ignavibacteria bacterium]
MRKYIFAFITVLILSNSSFAQWVVQTSGITANLYDVEFINRYTGWTLGDGGKVLKTTNGGINWMNIPNPSINGGGILSSIFPVDSLYCYVSGGHDVILKTTNGGANWIEISNGNPNGGIFNGVHFLNRDTGWFCGSSRVLRTTNGGLTFDTALTISFNSDIYFRNFNEGLYCTAGKVYKSTNSGMNWFNTNVPTNGWNYEFRKLSVVNNQYVSIIGTGDPFYRSTDFGTTWQCLDSIKSYPPSTMQAVAFSNINTGWVGGSYGYLYKTTNGGYNWYRQNTGTNQAFWGSIYCFNDSVVWGVGGAGKIMHTTTGGQWLVGVSNNENEVPLKYSLSQNYPNPFNPSTNIKFDVLSLSSVKIIVYDMIGREIQTLVNTKLTAGTYETTFDGSKLNSGVYFYKMVTNDFTLTKKMLLIK